MMMTTTTMVSVVMTTIEECFFKGPKYLPVDTIANLDCSLQVTMGMQYREESAAHIAPAKDRILPKYRK